MQVWLHQDLFINKQTCKKKQKTCEISVLTLFSNLNRINIILEKNGKWAQPLELLHGDIKRNTTFSLPLSETQRTSIIEI